MRVPKLSDDEVVRHLAKLPGWARLGDALVKQYKFPDFTHSLQFVNRVGEAAESINHHPDIDIRYNKVILMLTTHDSDGVTINDVELAASADDSADALSA